MEKHINYVSNKLRTVYFPIYKASSILDNKKIIYITVLPTYWLEISMFIVATKKAASLKKYKIMMQSDAF